MRVTLEELEERLRNQTALLRSIAGQLGINWTTGLIDLSGSVSATHPRWYFFEFDQDAETTPSTDSLLLCGANRLDTADYFYDGSLQVIKEPIDGLEVPGTLMWHAVWGTLQASISNGWEGNLSGTPGSGDALSLNYSRLLQALIPLLIAADSQLTGLDLRLGGPQVVSPEHWQPIGTVSFNGTTGPYVPCFGRWSNDGYCLLGFQDPATGGVVAIAHDNATVQAGQVRLALSFPLFLPLDPSSDAPVQRTSTWRSL